jgi:hypothetical protein
MGCLTVIVLFFLGIGTLIFGITNMISDSEPAQYAIEKAAESPIVIEALGEPIEDGIASGSISFNNGDGDADLRIPISGPKGSATLRVVAEKYDDSWSYEKIYVILSDSRQRIDLMQEKLDEP